MATSAETAQTTYFSAQRAAEVALRETIVLKEIAAGAVIIPDKVMSAIYVNSIFGGAGYINIVGLFDPSGLGINRLPHETIATVLDSSRCSGHMGGFGDTNAAIVEATLAGNSGEAFDNLTLGLQQHVNE